MTNKTKDQNNNPEPELIVQSMNAIKGCVFNGDELDRYIGSIEKDKGSRRYVVDRTAADYIRIGARPLGLGFYQYSPTFDVQMAGRISEEGAGLQACSREMKEAAFYKVDGVRNYDISSSQAYGLQVQLQAANISCKWLDDYLSDKSKRAGLASRLGMSVSCFKDCLYAVFYGATLREIAFVKGAVVRHGSVYSRLVNEFDDEAVARTKLEEFTEVVGPLKAAIDRWHQWLVTTFLDINSYWNREKRYVKNKCGKTLCVSDLSNADLKRTLAAFILQGLEACFIHTLTSQADEFGFDVLSNQHDGLVTHGEIPAEAMDRTRELTGLHTFVLVEKAFV